MKDLESRLRDSLGERAEEAPGSTGLAALARARLRRRRTALAKVLGAVVVAAAVPVLVVAVERVAEEAVDGGGGARRPASVVPDTPFIVPDLSPDSPDVRTARETRREVTWLNIRFAVPEDWKAGAVTAWCAKGNGKDPGRAVPRIDLPDEPRSTTVCTPTSGYGVSVTPAVAFDPDYNSRQVWEYDAGEDEPPGYPDGAWLSYWYDDEWVVTVATPDPGLTSRIVRSVRGDEIDVNGCAVFFDELETRTAVGPRGVGASLCRYTPNGELDDSQRLTERETSSALGAIAEAPDLAAGDHCIQQEGWLVTLTPAGQPAYLARYGTQGLGSCQDGVESTVPEQDPGGYVQITPDVVDGLELSELDVE